MSTEYQAPGPGRWAAVVHGRTRDQDLWWRALPAAISPEGPEARIILSSLANGRFAGQSGELPGPRFVLARLDRGTLLGVACQFRLISADMHANGSRALYGFVGWLSADPHAAVPTLAAVESGWVDWAGAEYERWMRPVWDETRNRVKDIDSTEGEPPRWGSALAAPYTGPVVGPEDQRWYDAPPPDRVRLHSSADRNRIWEGMTRWGRSAALVTGWGAAAEAARPGITHACVDGLPAGFKEIQLVSESGKPKVRPQAQPYRAGSGYSAGSAGYDYVAPAAQPGEQRYGGGPSRSGQPDIRDEQQADPGGRGLRRHLRKAQEKLQEAADFIIGDDPWEQAPAGQPGPPSPPGGNTPWTFSPNRLAFRARQGGFVYHAELGQLTIDCWREERPAEVFRFQAVGSDWVLEVVAKQGDAARRTGTSPQPGAPRAAYGAPGPADRAGAAAGPPAEPQIPKDIGRSLNATFGDDWGKDEAEAQERRPPGDGGTAG